MNKWRCVACEDDTFGTITAQGATFYECSGCGLLELVSQHKKEKYTFVDSRKYLQQVSPISALLYKLGVEKCLDVYYRLVFGIRGNTVKSYIKQGSILDIGTADGLFLRQFGSDKWSLSGIEINRHLAKKTQELLPRAKIYEQKLEKLELKKFDVVSAWHVWEHLDRPKQQAARLKKLLKPGGYLIMEMPNGESMWRKVFGGDWVLWMVPQHKFFWNEKSIRTFLSKFGLTIVEVKQVGLVSSGPGSAARRWGVVWAMMLFPLFLVLNIFAGKRKDNLLVVAKKL
jgi:2-polyprenyl-3-methyl-5-hydroxy-6-metoxy-1,4-benzoquinol methylase